VHVQRVGHRLDIVGVQQQGDRGSDLHILAGIDQDFREKQTALDEMEKEIQKTQQAMALVKVGSEQHLSYQEQLAVQTTRFEAARKRSKKFDEEYATLAWSFKVREVKDNGDGTAVINSATFDANGAVDDDGAAIIEGWNLVHVEAGVGPGDNFTTPSAWPVTNFTTWPPTWVAEPADGDTDFRGWSMRDDQHLITLFKWDFTHRSYSL